MLTRLHPLQTPKLLPTEHASRPHRRKQRVASELQCSTWADVLKFVAKEADLNLQADSYPPGTFSYSAPRRRYSVAQSDRIMNGALLDKGFTLIQKNGVIKSVDLTAGESPDQIRGLIREYASWSIQKS